MLNFLVYFVTFYFLYMKTLYVEAIEGMVVRSMAG
jgi:hypothetical protein